MPSAHGSLRTAIPPRPTLGTVARPSVRRPTVTWPMPPRHGPTCAGEIGFNERPKGAVDGAQSVNESRQANRRRSLCGEQLRGWDAVDRERGTIPGFRFGLGSAHDYFGGKPVSENADRSDR